MYAEGESKEATTFNCIQRSHQNSSEQIGPVLVTQALLGLYHPITAASLGAIWAIGKPWYLSNTLARLSFNTALTLPARQDILVLISGSFGTFL